MKSIALAALLVFTACTIETSVDPAAGEASLAAPRPVAAPRNDDERFYNYRLEAFAPDTEPLVGETFGATLALADGAPWEHAAYTSAAISFATNLPAFAVVEYGATTDYGLRSEAADGYYYRHLHYMKELEPGETYHYRIVAQAHDGQQTVSADHTLATVNMPAAAIRIPEDMNGGAPYTLDRDNALYVLTRDLAVATLAINIRAHNVTVELDGHTIVYDDGAPTVVATTWDGYAYNEAATFGIRAGLWNFTNTRVYNGTIRQGRNGGRGLIGTGFGPLFLNHMAEATQNDIAGVTVDYYGDDIHGMVTGNGRVHHNVVIDRGSVVTDRHMGIMAVVMGKADSNEFYGNSLRRFRHQGVRGSGWIHHNELYSDSFATNSFMIAQGEGGRVEDNLLFGMGYMPIGIGWANRSSVRRNFIYIHGWAPTLRSDEYNRRSGITGMRITNYSVDTYHSDMLFEDNTIVLKAEDGCSLARGIWTSNNERSSRIVYRRNTVKVEAMPGNVTKTGSAYYNDDVNAAVTAVAVCDDNAERPVDGSGGMPPQILFEDNRFAGNVNLVTIGDGYGISNNVRMLRTRLEKIAHDSEYFRPVRLGFWYWHTFGNVLVDTECVNIADSEMTPHFYGSRDGYMEISYGESHEIILTDGSNPLRNTVVTVAPGNALARQAVTDNAGRLAFDLLAVQHLSNRGSISRNDYRSYTFTAAGYQPFAIDVSQLKQATRIALTRR
jgi:hypothetical protein